MRAEKLARSCDTDAVRDERGRAEAGNKRKETAKRLIRHEILEQVLALNCCVFYIIIIVIAYLYPYYNHDKNKNYYKLFTISDGDLHHHHCYHHFSILLLVLLSLISSSFISTPLSIISSFHSQGYRCDKASGKRRRPFGTSRRSESVPRSQLRESEPAREQVDSLKKINR